MGVSWGEAQKPVQDRRKCHSLLVDLRPTIYKEENSVKCFNRLVKLMSIDDLIAIFTNKTLKKPQPGRKPGRQYLLTDFYSLNHKIRLLSY